jgi:hypothetical protein
MRFGGHFEMSPKHGRSVWGRRLGSPYSFGHRLDFERKNFKRVL